MGLFENIITKEMATLAVAAIAIMTFIGKIPIKYKPAYNKPIKSKPINKTKIWKNWGIFLLFIICTAGSFTPGVHEIPCSEWGGILVFAFTTSMVALLGRTILKPIFLSKLEGKK